MTFLCNGKNLISNVVPCKVIDWHVAGDLLIEFEKLVLTEKPSSPVMVDEE